MTKRKMKLRGKITIFLLVAIVITVIFNFLDFSFKKDNNTKPPVVNEPKTEEYELSLVMAGDVLIHGAIYLDAQISPDEKGIMRYDFRSIFSEIKDYFLSYDLRFVNQESPIGGQELGVSSYPTFNSPYEIGDALLDLGVNLVSLANNHTLDAGTNGVENSLKYWGNSGAIYAGSFPSKEAQEPAISEMNGIKYAFFAYTESTNGISVPIGKEHYISLVDYDKITSDIEKVKDKVDIIIVSMHWGNEYELRESSKQREDAKFLADLGVDIIIGHHPHVVQPVEFIEREDGRKTFVAYSLGNFIAAQGCIDRRVGVLVGLDIKKKVVDNNTEIELLSPRAMLFYQNSDNNRKKYKIIPFSKMTNELLRNSSPNNVPAYPNLCNYSDKSLDMNHYREKYEKILTKYVEDLEIVR